MLMLDQITESALELTKAHAAWAAPITFAIAFVESLAVVSLFVPATVMLLGLGALIAAGAIEFWQVFAAAVVGAVAGNSASYWFGRRFKHSIEHSWFFRKRPHLLSRGHAFFEQHGGKSVFFGRFFGPTRAVVPLVAGMTEMPRRRFLLANAASAIVWVLLSISPAVWSGTWLPGMPHPAEAGEASAARPADPQGPAVPLR
jgi:membrane protein DedA with SNARE-associated domain